MKILAVDPGEMTGVATYLDGKFYSLQLPSINAGPFIRGFVDAAEQRGQSVLVVCERFVIGTNTAKYTRQPAATALIGVLDDHIKPMTHVAFELQNSSEAKKIGKDSLLKRIEWWNPRKEHANDAARHVLYGLLRHDPAEYLAVRSGDTIEINRVEVEVAETGEASMWLSRP